MMPLKVTWTSLKCMLITMVQIPVSYRIPSPRYLASNLAMLHIQKEQVNMEGGWAAEYLYSIKLSSTNSYSIYPLFKERNVSCCIHGSRGPGGIFPHVRMIQSRMANINFQNEKAQVSRIVQPTTSSTLGVYDS